jgi:hypothetical protein
MGVVDASFGHPLKLEEDATMPLAGGIMSYGYQCGMLWGAALAGGAQAHRLFGPGAQAEAAAIHAAQRIVAAFRARNDDEMNCFEITNLNMKGETQVLPVLKFLFTGGAIGCFRMAAGYAPEAYQAINAALSEAQLENPSLPVSCAAALARAMGESDMHTVMAAGLAGGIGLGGGACGALGAAIWIIGMRGRLEGADSKAINARIEAAIEKFLAAADYEFECSKIVGRKFVGVSEHAAHLRDGGCAGIIAALSATP